MNEAWQAPWQGQRIRRLKGAASFLFGAVVFGISCTQAPLYYSNQNQYFLPGLASGGRGFLTDDWLANTRDPTPIFSAGVAFTYRYLHEYFFCAYYLLVLGLYFHALLGIAERFAGSGRLARWLLATLLVAIHAGLTRWASAQLVGVDYPWYFQAGVAGQYVLGFGLQPSVFGVFLAASIDAFLRDRPYLAATWASLGAVVHSTYLVGAAFLVVSYLIILYRERRTREALGTGTWALVLVLPVVVRHLVVFAPSSVEQFAEAQRLLVHFRIPHHAVPSRWFDGIAALQLAWLGAAVYLARKTRLFPVLVISALLGFFLTLAQLATSSDMLALLFPWRISAVLVPVATAVILGRLTGWLSPWLDQRPPAQRRVIWWACGLALAAFVAGGLAISCGRLAYHVDPGEEPLLEYVRRHKEEGDTYLLPVELPRLGSGRRGSVSMSFLPPLRREGGHRMISVDLQRFRLDTGAPIFVDFKSIPYKDEEVLDWHRRLRWAHEIYEREDWDRADLPTELASRRITHVVVPGDRAVRSGALEQVHAAAGYRVYRVRPATRSASQPQAPSRLVKSLPTAAFGPGMRFLSGQ